MDNEEDLANVFITRPNLARKADQYRKTAGEDVDGACLLVRAIDINKERIVEGLM